MYPSHELLRHPLLHYYGIAFDPHRVGALAEMVVGDTMYGVLWQLHCR